MTRNVWLIAEKSYEYNDEWYREVGTSACSVYLTEEAAEAACAKMNKEWMRTSSDIFQLNADPDWTWETFFICDRDAWCELLRTAGIEPPEGEPQDDEYLSGWWEDMLTGSTLTEDQKDYLCSTCTLTMYNVIEVPAHGFDNLNPETAT